MKMSIFEGKTKILMFVIVHFLSKKGKLKEFFKENTIVEQLVFLEKVELKKE